jgi:hypothetical protein
LEPQPLRIEHYSVEEIQDCYTEWTQKLYHQLGQKILDRKKVLPFVSLDQVIAGLRDAQQGSIIDLEDNWEMLDQLDLLSRLVQ